MFGEAEGAGEEKAGGEGVTTLPPVDDKTMSSPGMLSPAEVTLVHYSLVYRPLLATVIFPLLVHHSLVLIITPLRLVDVM